MTANTQKHPPLFQTLSDMKAPRGLPELIADFLQKEEQQKEMLAWMEITGEKSWDEILDHAAEIQDRDFTWN